MQLKSAQQLVNWGFLGTKFDRKDLTKAHQSESRDGKIMMMMMILMAELATTTHVPVITFNAALFDAMIRRQNKLNNRPEIQIYVAGNR